MKKYELQRRVDARKQELTEQQDRLAEYSGKIAAFVEDIKSRSAVYALVKNLKLWKELEKLLPDGESDGD